MVHELMKEKHMIAVTLRYQCPCDGREVIALSVMFAEHDFADEIKFLETMRYARRDMITEIRQHTGVKNGG